MRKAQRGASLVEYMILLSLVLLVAIPAVRALAHNNRCNHCSNAWCMANTSTCVSGFKQAFMAACVGDPTYTVGFGC